MDPGREAGNDPLQEGPSAHEDKSSRQHVLALLQEGLDSGTSDKSWDELITELNIKYFGKDQI